MSATQRPRDDTCLSSVSIFHCSALKPLFKRSPSHLGTRGSHVGRTLLASRAPNTSAIFPEGCPGGQVLFPGRREKIALRGVLGGSSWVCVWVIRPPARQTSVRHCSRCIQSAFEERTPPVPRCLIPYECHSAPDTSRPLNESMDGRQRDMGVRHKAIA